MAECYHSQAHFRDIAFDLDGVDEIHNMWRMICTGESNIKVKFEVVEADDQSGRVGLIDSYRFGAQKDKPESGRPIINLIESRFQFKEGKILHHHDRCDAKEWARQALDDGTPKGRIKSFLAGRIRPLRSRTARKLLDAFVQAPPA